MIKIIKQDNNYYLLFDTLKDKIIIENESMQVCDNIRSAIIYNQTNSECGEIAKAYITKE